MASEQQSVDSGLNCVDLLEEAIQLAMSSGFEVRQEWLHEKGCGACRIGERWTLFIDLSMSASEQLETVVAALRQRATIPVSPMTSPEMRALLANSK